MESRTLTSIPAVLYRSVWERLIHARRVLLISPAKPDGDSLGSLCGLALALRSAGCDPVLYCPDPIPSQFDIIPRVHDICVGASSMAHGPSLFDVMVICDASDLPYTGVADDLPRWKAPHGSLIVIDHHATNTMYGDVNLVLPASSTTQIIAAMLETNRVPLTPQIATALYIGLITDTDSLTNPATSAAASATAARLVAAGARPGTVLRAVYQNKPIGVLQLWGKAFSRLRVHPRYDVVTTVLLPEDFVGLSEDAAERGDGLSNFLQNILPVRAICVLKDRGDGIVRGSLRTTRDGVELGALARALGGGGHKKASGFGVPGHLVPHGDYWKLE